MTPETAQALEILSEAINEGRYERDRVDPRNANEWEQEARSALATLRAQLAGRDGEGVVHRWVRDGEAVGPWTDGRPTDRQIKAAAECAALATWTVEYAYTHPAPAVVLDWLPIESAPKDKGQSRMLLAWADGTVEQGMFVKNETWQGFRPESLRPWPNGQPTHWRPLPVPPALTEGGSRE